MTAKQPKLALGASGPIHVDWGGNSYQFGVGFGVYVKLPDGRVFYVGSEGAKRGLKVSPA